MDNLTHAMIGALLGQIGLKKKTGLAMPTLIIAANIPDIDATCIIYGMESLSMRRGITHGPIAMLVLPLLLWALMLAFDRWQTKRGKRPDKRLPVHKGWLLALAYLGCLSHPAMDWMNVYGVRLLEPFSSTWFYGDVLFIIDVWIWIALGLTLFLSLNQERRGLTYWKTTAQSGFFLICAYIFANGLITGAAERMAQSQLQQAGMKDPITVASPPPLAFWKRDIFWRNDGIYGSGDYLLGQGLKMELQGKPTAMDDPRLPQWLAGDATAEAFHFWARMPVIERDEPNGPLYLRDQRYHDPRSKNRFAVILSNGRNKEERRE